MRGHDKISSFVVLTILMILAGCAGPGQQRQEGNSTQEREIPVRDVDYGELTDQVYVDMYAEGEGDWRDPWQPDIAPPARFDLMAGRDESRKEVEEASLEQMQGFRIQLLDVLTQEDANAAHKTALEKFTHVYITFRSPNYKIRAGNYKSRVDAEQELPLARECGFRNAWIVPDWVYVNPPALAGSDSLMTGNDHIEDLSTEATHEE